jgi:hypothetical protein
MLTITLGLTNLYKRGKVVSYYAGAVNSACISTGARTDLSTIDQKFNTFDGLQPTSSKWKLADSSPLFAGHSIIVIDVDGAPMGCGTIEKGPIENFKPTKDAPPKYYHYPTGPEPAVPYYDRGGHWIIYLILIWLGGVLILVLSWLLFACSFDKPRSHVVKSRLLGDPNDGDVNVKNTGALQMTGYASHLLGSIAFGAVHSLSLLLFAVYLVLVVDYYIDCDFSSVVTLIL